MKCVKCEKIAIAKQVCSTHYSQIWRATNPQKHKAIVTKRNNSDSYKNYKKHYRQDNKQKIARYMNNKLKTDINFRLLANLRNRIRAAIKNKSESTKKLLGCSISELKTHISTKFKPGMTWDNWTVKGWHLDHIIPLSKFDLSDPAQLQKAMHFTNLQPLWAFENQSKGAR